MTPNVDGRPEWEPAFVLPNLMLDPEDTRFPGEFSLGLDGITIVPASDARVAKIRAWSPPADEFLGSFHDGHDKSITPAVLIVSRDRFIDMARAAKPIISFRNAVAVSSILPTRARASNGWSSPSWSQAFDYNALELSLDGRRLDIRSPALQGYGVLTDGLSLSRDIRLPREASRLVDHHLAARLGRLWRRAYRRKRDIRSAERVFRSLEVAYEALAMRSRHYDSVPEAGLGAIYWSTAIEILAAPSKGRVTKWHCVKLLRAPGDAEPPPGSGFRKSPIWTRRWWVPMESKKSRCHMNLPQRLFLRLYDARNHFVHGHEAKKRVLAPLGSNVSPLLYFASSIYRLALKSYLDEHWPCALASHDGLWLDLDWFDYEDHLAEALGEPLLV